MINTTLYIEEVYETYTESVLQTYTTVVHSSNDKYV